jgi:predicted MPP superfamily phosphohydrolase
MRPVFSRRDFLKLLKAAAIEVPVLGFGTWYYGHYIEPEHVEVVNITLILPHLPRTYSGVKLAQISDIHIGGLMTVERLGTFLDMVASQQPDLVVITGDFVIGGVWNYEIEAMVASLTEMLEPFARRFTTFAVLGNHDYLVDADAVREMLVECGITELENSLFQLRRGDDQLYLAGLDDLLLGHPRIDDVLSGLPEKACAILLVHEPDRAEHTAATGRFDLQISGHSHGGQVIVPPVGPIFLPELGSKFPLGLYKTGGMYHYTNRGLGTTGVDMRINCRPEISLFTLQSPEGGSTQSLLVNRPKPPSSAAFHE